MVRVRVFGGDSVPRLPADERNREQRKPGRRRQAPVKPTPEEKAQRAAARQTKKQAYNDALQSAREQLRALAEGLHAQFPEHNTEYHYRTLINASKLNKNTREVTGWQAYISMGMEERGAGK